MKKIAVLLTTMAAVVLLSITAFAGSWEQNAGGWKYKLDNGTYATNGWQWIDSNGDGLAESYYFDANGFCLQNTTTPDGYTVDANGAWVKDGKIQTQAVAKAAASTATAKTASTGTTSGATQYVLNTNSKKFHKPGCTSVKKMSAGNRSDVTDTRANIIAQGYSPCHNCNP